MKTLLGICLCILGFAAEAADQLQIIRQGKEVKGSPQDNFVTNIVALVQSASVNTTADAIRAHTWENIQTSNSFVHLTFTPSRELMVMLQPGVGQRHREKTLVNEIIIPLPENHWPDHLFFRSGKNIFAVAKYDPIALKRVAFEPVLNLSTVKPYVSLKDIEHWDTMTNVPSIRCD